MMIKKIILLFILMGLLTSTAMAMSKDMTRSNIRFAKAGDIIQIPSDYVAAACDFAQQITIHLPMNVFILGTIEDNKLAYKPNRPALFGCEIMLYD